MNNNDYVRLSLELHLFFDRIMKEHSFFLETAFTEKDNDLRVIANKFQKMFSDILDRALTLADGKVTNPFLESHEIVTNHTLDAERKSSSLSGVLINTNLTEKELQLKSGKVNASEELVNNIRILNRRTLSAVENLISFKNDVLNSVLSCKMYTTNYLLLLTHIMNEAKMYLNLLRKLENKESFDEKYIYEQEVFWSNIMKEHAEFIRGLLDPSEKQLIITADKFAKEYEVILNRYSKNPHYLTMASLNETIHFRNFKVTGEEGILNCKVKSIIIPLLADHVVREANHFIRILQNINKTVNRY